MKTILFLMLLLPVVAQKPGDPPKQTFQVKLPPVVTQELQALERSADSQPTSEPSKAAKDKLRMRIRELLVGHPEGSALPPPFGFIVEPR